MMTTMLGLTLLTLTAILISIKRLRPISEKSSSTDLQATGDDRSSSLGDDSDEPASALALPSKKCYITLVQHDDDEDDNEEKRDQYVLEKTANGKARSNNDGFTGTTRYRTSSTNVICQSDDQPEEV